MYTLADKCLQLTFDIVVSGIQITPLSTSWTGSERLILLWRYQDTSFPQRGREGKGAYGRPDKVKPRPAFNITFAVN